MPTEPDPVAADHPATADRPAAACRCRCVGGSCR